MYPFFSSELAHHHQETLLREAKNERMAQLVRRQIEVISPSETIAPPQSSLSESDFVAIRRDLRSTLSEWSLEAGTTSREIAIDTFMQHLRKRLGASPAKFKSATH